MASAADTRASSGVTTTNSGSVRGPSQAQQQKDAATAQQQGAGAQDPDKNLLAQSCFDFMMIEVVGMSQRLAEELHQRELRVTGGRSAQVRRRKQQQQQDGAAGKGQEVDKLDEDEIREAMFFRLEGLGYRVGLGIVESLTATTPLLHPAASSSGASAPTSSTSPGAASLDTIKFLCKDLWIAVFRKQIDNLKTNHRGVFVLTDQRFEPLRRASLPSTASAGGGGVGSMGPRGEEEARNRAGPFLFFPTGLIRGALAGLNIEANVSAEIAPAGLPGVIFQIRTGPGSASAGGSQGGGGGAALSAGGGLGR